MLDNCVADESKVGLLNLQKVTKQLLKLCNSTIFSQR